MEIDWIFVHFPLLAEIAKILKCFPKGQLQSDSVDIIEILSPLLELVLGVLIMNFNGLLV